MEKKFKRADNFIGCNEALETMFVPANGSFFRVVHKPLIENDKKVQSEQQFEGLAPSNPNLPRTIAENSSVDEQYDHICDWSTSFYKDEESLVSWYFFELGRRKTEKQKQNFITRKGDHVAKFDLVPNTGLIQKVFDDDGHTVHVEYDDFNLEAYQDKEFGYKPLKSYRDETGK